MLFYIPLVIFSKKKKFVNVKGLSKFFEKDKIDLVIRKDDYTTLSDFSLIRASHTEICVTKKLA
ncbi:MAG: hypothetical protein RMJ17_00895 [Candidatus Aenigmarchaeota archaeon]|nr:hypothetical protein [Candidatus Aenigmarchaeota archaeon]MDW8149143.1 hypothetical protein [Candidatus Aenigmarchaeota archaeon]